jgi:site-specific DNA-methyltransferase (adenine-specific)
MGQTRMAKLKPAFSTDLGSVYNVDCMNLLATVGDDLIDTVFADPPFNLAKDYGNGKDKDDLKNGDYLTWCYSWMDECIRVLKPGGSMFVYNMPQWAFHLAAHLERKGMTFRHWIAVSMKGTFPRGRKLYPAHYALLYFTKGNPTTFNRVRLPVPACRHCGKDVKDYGGHRKFLNPLGLNLTDIWEDTAPARHHKFKARWHVNELKPVIPGRCIEMSTDEGAIILDPFGGGGSTFEAAQKLKRHWVGSEIVDCELIRERFERNIPGVQRAKTPPTISAIFVNQNGEKSSAYSCPESLVSSHSTEQKHLFEDSALTSY